MPESPLPRRSLWPPPPETPEVRKEQVMLTAGIFNAAAIACLVTGFVGPIITAIPDEELSPPVRIALIAAGIALHLAARAILRYMAAQDA